MKIKLSVFLVALALAGCGDSSDSSLAHGNSGTEQGAMAGGNQESTQTVNSIQEAIVVLEKAGKLPVLDRSDTLAGTDSDQNGIRDDIDNYIEELPVQLKQKESLKGFATGLQSVQTINLEDAGEVKAVSQQMVKSIVCLGAAFDDEAASYKHLKSLEGYTANTPERAEQYNQFNEVQNGSVTRLPRRKDCQ